MTAAPIKRELNPTSNAPPEGLVRFDGVDDIRIQHREAPVDCGNPNRDVIRPEHLAGGPGHRSHQVNGLRSRGAPNRITARRRLPWVIGVVANGSELLPPIERPAHGERGGSVSAIRIVPSSRMVTRLPSRHALLRW